MHQQHTTLATYFELMNCNGAVRVYQAARECGIIDALREGAQSIDQLSDRLSLQPHPVKLLLDALEAIELVERTQKSPVPPASADSRSRQDLFELAEVLKLLSDEYADLGGSYWDQLPKFLATGKPLKHMDDVGESEFQYAKQAASLRWMMTPAAMEAASYLQQTPASKRTQPYHILDVAAGSAIWSLSAARINPQAIVTAVDWSGVLSEAENTASQMGLAQRYQSLAGNIFDVSLPAEKYDQVIVANFAHLLPAEKLLTLLTKLHGATKPGGQLVVVDVFSGQATGDISRTLYQLGLEMRTAAGRTYQSKELQSIVERAGIGSTHFRPLKAMPHTMGFVAGRKQE